MLSLASRVITYHQSKLIIADWVGVVNDYRRGRAGAVSHTVLQSMVNLAKEEEGLGVRPVCLVSTGKLPPLKTAKKSGAE